MLKDLSLSQQAAGESGMATPLGGHAAAIYRQFVESGNGNTDFSGIIRFLEGMKGLNMGDVILTQRHGRVGVVTIDRPEALNAMNTPVMEGLIAAAAAFDADEDIGCIVITGAGKAFAAGADIKEMADKSFSTCI